MLTMPRPTLLVCTVAVALSGCTPLNPPAVAKSPLLPVRMSPDSVALDLFFVRCPFNDANLNQTPVGQRRRAALPGRGCGWLGCATGSAWASWPTRSRAAIAQLMELNDPSGRCRTSSGLEQQVDLLSQSRVAKRHLQTPPRRPQRNRHLGHVRRIAAVGLRTGPDRRADLQQGPSPVQMCGPPTSATAGWACELTPEIHYGENRQRWAAEPGCFAWKPASRVAASIRWPSGPRSRRGRCW